MSVEQKQEVNPGNMDASMDESWDKCAVTHSWFVSVYMCGGDMKINEKTLLEGHSVVLVPYNAEHVPR